MYTRLLWVLGAFLVLTASLCLAGEDTGLPDTVRVGCPIRLKTEPDSISVPIYLWNDEALGGLTLGLRITPEYLVFSSWSVTTGDIPPIKQSNFGVTYNADSNTILLGWIDLTGTNNVAATTTTQGRRLVTLYFRCSPGIHITGARIDSTYIPPAAPFILAGKSGGFKPQFVECVQFIDAVDENSDFASPLVSPALLQNSPNPFNSATAIAFDLPRPSWVRLDIMNILGENVATLVRATMMRGHHETTWEGTDDNGRSMPSGVYFYRLRAGDQVQTKKMLLLK